MTSNRADRLTSLYHAALERPASERAGFLAQACADDDALRGEVESLLAYDAQSFLEPAAAQPAVVAGPRSDRTSMVNRQLGPYTIVAPLGAGGMGEVYRARDSKLGRDVAIKILPPYLMADAERRARFAREARMLATLNHPNIGAIYGLEEFDGMTALVLELVEGMTLADRLERGPLPLSQTLSIAREIVEALDAAHEKGIIHRDLKPANIILQGATDLRSDGARAKVLDFGLAKPLATNLDDGPTISREGTVEGRILGTPAYMSPEQARGQPVDARTDVWAFGCVLYEMMTGRQAFGGTTTSDTIAKILERDPDWQALPPGTAPGIRKLLSRCLEKDPRRRLHAIADATFEIDEALAESNARLETATRTRVRTRGWLIAAGVGVLVLAGSAWTLWSTRSAHPPSPRVMPLTSYPGIESSPTFSPDGKQVAFSWDGEKGDNENIYVLMVGADNPLPVTRHPARDVSPAWRPDGSQIAFARMESDRASIYLVSPHGDSEQKLADFSAIPPTDGGPIEARDPRLSWSPDGRWLAVTRVTSGTEGGIFLVAEDGNTSVLLPAKPGDDYRIAMFSPMGNALACVNGGYIDVVGISGTTPPTVNGASRRVTPFLGNVSGLAWTVEGKALLFGRSYFPAPDPPSLWRVAASGDFAPERIELAGVSAYPSVSATGSRLAFVRRGLNEDLFRLQEGRPPETILSSTSNEQDASFSPDGSKIAFATDRGGEGNEIWVAHANDATTRRSVTKGAHKPEGTPRWSPNGHRLAFDGRGEDGLSHIYVVDEAGGPIHEIGKKVGADDHIPSWSRDGKWIYFGSNRSGPREVWRAPAAGGEPQQITTTGGDAPFESKDGFLYYSRPVGGVTTLFSKPVTGGRERPLGITVTFWNYVPGEKGLYYMTPGLGAKAPYTFEVRLMDFTTGKSEKLHVLSMDLMSPGLSVTPDGKTVLVEGVALVTQDLMRIENFR